MLSALASSTEDFPSLLEVSTFTLPRSIFIRSFGHAAILSFTPECLLDCVTIAELDIKPTRRFSTHIMDGGGFPATAHISFICKMATAFIHISKLAFRLNCRIASVADTTRWIRLSGTSVDPSLDQALSDRYRMTLDCTRQVSAQFQ
jgi:hypothetical protein